MNPDELYRKVEELFPSCKAKRVSGPSWYVTCHQPFSFGLFTGFEGRNPELTVNMASVTEEDWPLLADLIQEAQGKTTLDLKLDVKGGWVVADLVCDAKPTVLCYIASPNPEAGFHRAPLLSSPIAPTVKEQMDACLHAEPDEEFKSVATEAYNTFLRCVESLEEAGALKVDDWRGTAVLSLIEDLKADYPSGSLQTSSYSWTFTSTEPFRFAVHWVNDPEFTDLLTLSVDLKTVDDSDLHLIPELIEKVNPDGVNFTVKHLDGEAYAVGGVNLILDSHVIVLTTNTRPRSHSITDEDTIVGLLEKAVENVLSEESDSALKESAADFYDHFIRQVRYLEGTGILKKFI